MTDLPMPRKQQRCYLRRVIVNWQKKTVKVHLHGEQHGFINRKRIEIITLNIVPDMTEQEAVRVAAFMSPCAWIISLFSPMSQYKNGWNEPLDERLQAALTDPSRISISLS